MSLEVVGESHYQENIWRAIQMRGPSRERVRVPVAGVLRAERDNRFDPNAISVWLGGHQAGYLSSDDAPDYRPGLLALERRYRKPVALPGLVVGGGMRSDGPGLLGVFLRFDPDDFGIDADPDEEKEEAARVRTGLTRARVADAADDSYDLGWLDHLPEDRDAQIGSLRSLLGTITDPIDRHFLFGRLELALYHAREEKPAALTDYDEVCRQHDAEMDRIRDAFLAKLSGATFRSSTLTGRWQFGRRKLTTTHKRSGGLSEASRSTGTRLPGPRRSMIFANVRRMPAVG